MFQRGWGGGGHTVSNIIVMAFLPRNIGNINITKGGGHGHPRTPPRYALARGKGGNVSTIIVTKVVV